MKTRRYGDQEIAELLITVDRRFDRQSSIKEVCEELGISRSNLYRWRKRYGLQTPISKQLQKAEREQQLANQLARSQEENHALRIAAEGN
jgi:transposase-like protein